VDKGTAQCTLGAVYPTHQADGIVTLFPGLRLRSNYTCRRHVGLAGSRAIRRYHDHNVKEFSFNVGDLVLRRIQNTEGLYKLSSPWEGPFTVAKVTGPGSYRLHT
jgi:hypothetical protein